MNFIKILNSKEKAEIEKKLREQFAVDSIPGLIVQRGEERLFLFSGSFSEKEIKQLEKCTFIERMGVYFAKIIGNNIRLSIEGSQLLSAQVKKNIFELNPKEAEEWMKGHELPIKTGEHKFLIMKCGKDFLGTGKASEEKIGNFIPKNRRLRDRQQ
jgi:NOL1/NOP2/fmu family ribosome biogenesis protein